MNFKKLRWDMAAVFALAIASIGWAAKMERNTARTATGVEFFKEAYKEVAATQKEFRAALDSVRQVGTLNRQRNDDQDRRLDDHSRKLDQINGTRRP